MPRPTPAPTSRIARRPVPVALLAAIATLGLGCAGAPTASPLADAPLVGTHAAAPGSLVELTPVGPGGVFPSAEAAALDALAWAHLRSRATPVGLRRARGGAVRAIEGGFTYDEPTRAARGGMPRLRYPLTPSDPAHFVYHPARPRVVSNAGATRAIDAASLRLVDERDRSGRPFYYMTPRRHVRVVEAGRPAARTLARVAFSARRPETSLRLAISTTAAGELDASLAALPRER